MKPSLKYSLTAMFTAVALITFIIENLFPPLLFPGARMGLSNILILLCAILCGPIEASICLIIKTVLGSIFAGNVSAIMYSLPAGAISLTIQIILLYFIKKISVVAISICGAVINTCIQNLTFCLVTATIEYLYYLPYLALIGVLAGMVTGLTTYLIIKHLPRKIFNETNEQEN
jgi:heptaprenyl diphosphate synthase